MASKAASWASLLVQWLGEILPVQRTRFDPQSRKLPHASEQLGRIAKLQLTCHNYTKVACIPSGPCPTKEQPTQ